MKKTKSGFGYDAMDKCWILHDNLKDDYVGKIYAKIYDRRIMRDFLENQDMDKYKIMEILDWPEEFRIK